MTNPFHYTQSCFPIDDPSAVSWACTFESGEIPAELWQSAFQPSQTIMSGQAVQKRKCEHLAGRMSAAKALRILEMLHSCEEERGEGNPVVFPSSSSESRAPLWPEGVQGSITHTKNFAACMVSCRENYFVGIDTETLRESSQMFRSLQKLVILEQEWQRLCSFVPLTEMQLAILIFSAKESLYKCLYPLCQMYFDFSYAEILEIDIIKKTFLICLKKPLAPFFAAGLKLEGRFFLEKDKIHTQVYYLHS